MLVKLPTAILLVALSKQTLASNHDGNVRKLHPRQLAEHQDNSTDCAGYALNRGTWAELGIDNYLLHYPGGKNMSLAQYTNSINVLNFECGIGLTCLSGQLCHPVRGRDWVVLSAVQEWNFYINSVYEAVGSAMSTVQGTAAAMVADFLPEGQDKKILIALTIGLLGLSGVIMLGFTAALLVPILWQVLRMTWTVIAWSATTTGSGIAAGWTWLTTLGAEETIATAGATELAGETGAMEGGGAATGLVPHRLRKRHDDVISHDKFQMWSAVNAHLSVLQDRLQAVISLADELTLTSPISSPQGIFGALQNGTFLSDHPPRAVLQNNVAEAAQLGALAQLFKVMNMMFVIDSVPCRQEGPTTPLNKPEAVHYCSPEGVKTSLGRIHGKKIDYKVRNGRLIFAKYSYSTEFLSQLAMDCQTQRSGQGLGPNSGNLALVNTGPMAAQSIANVNSSAGPSSEMKVTTPAGEVSSNNATLANKDPLSSTILLPDGTSVCSFPIPICDLRLPEVKSLISSGKTPAEACRQGLKLDI